MGLAALISHREPRKVAGIGAILGAQPAEKDEALRGADRANPTRGGFSRMHHGRSGGRPTDQVGVRAVFRNSQVRGVNHWSG